MQQYRLDPEQYKKVKKKVLSIMIPIGGVILSILIITQGIEKDGSFNFIPALVVIVVFCGLMWFLRSTTLKKQKEVYESYRLTIHDNLIIREQLNTPKLEIYVNEISSMTKTKDNNIIIKGKTPQDLIYIPSQTENFEALERKLEEFMLIAPAEKKFVQRYFWAIYLLAFASMIVSLTSMNVIVVTLCGAPTILLLIVIYIRGMQNKNLDRRGRSRLFSFLFVSLLLIANIIYKWMFYNPY